MKATFDKSLFRHFWLEIARRPGASETDVLMDDDGRKYAAIFQARNHNLACEAFQGDCDACALSEFGKSHPCMSFGNPPSSLYVRWHTAMLVARIPQDQDFAGEREKAIMGSLSRFNMDAETPAPDNPALFRNITQREAIMLATSLAREIAGLPFRSGRPPTRKLKRLDLLQMIWTLPPGEKFSAPDFRLFGPPALIGWHLCTLAQAGVIRRVGHGRYVHGKGKTRFTPLHQKIVDTMREMARSAQDAELSFSRADFSEYGGIDAVSQQLSRMARKGEIVRAGRGRYRLSDELRPIILRKRHHGRGEAKASSSQAGTM